MFDSDNVVAAYNNHAAAESSVKQLWMSGYDVRKLSIVMDGFRCEERVVGFYSAADRVRRWGKNGALWGGALGLLFGAAVIAIPDIEARRLVVALAAWIQLTFGGAITVGGLSALSAAVYSMTMPKNSVLKYQMAIVEVEEFLLIARGAPGEVAAARAIMRNLRPAEWSESLSAQSQSAGAA